MCDLETMDFESQFLVYGVGGLLLALLGISGGGVTSDAAGFGCNNGVGVEQVCRLWLQQQCWSGCSSSVGVVVAAALEWL